MTTEKILQQICTLSKHRVCIFDLKAVAEKAREIGLVSLAELAEREKDNSTGGAYYAAIKSLYGVTA